MSSQVWQRLVFGLLLVGFLVYVAQNFDDDRVRKVCRRVMVGASVAELNRYANEVGLAHRIVPSGITSLAEGKTFGSYRCHIEASDGVVRNVTFEGDTG